MYRERKHELIFISKESEISQRHGEIPIREHKTTLLNPGDLTHILEDVANFLRASGFSFIQELSYTTYTYTEEDSIYDCCGKGCGSDEDEEEIKQELVDRLNNQPVEETKGVEDVSTR